MNVMIRLLTCSALLLALALPAAAQGPSPQGSSQPWRLVEEQLGLETTYSVDMVVQTMGMNMNTRVVRDGEKSRTEMTMPFMNIEMAMIEFPEGGKTVSYSLFPEKKKYMLNEDDSMGNEPVVAPEIEDLGTEEYQGVACDKRRITMTQEGVSSDMTVLLSPRQKNMPVKMTVSAEVPMQPGQPPMPVQTTVLFQNYDFSTPDASLFAVPSDDTLVNDMMEIMMDGDGSEGLGALMQQMQQMEVEE